MYLSTSLAQTLATITNAFHAADSFTLPRYLLVGISDLACPDTLQLLVILKM